MGYLPRLKACKEIFIGDAVVTIHEGRALVKAFNTLNEDVELFLPQVELEEIEKFAYIKPYDPDRSSPRDIDI